MRSFIFFSILYTCLVSAIGTIVILFLAEISWGKALLIWFLSVIVINTVHALVLQGVILPYVERDVFNPTEKFFYTLLPWLVVSALLVIFIQQPDPISLSLIAIQYLTASFSYFFYFSELKKEKRELQENPANAIRTDTQLEVGN